MEGGDGEMRSIKDIQKEIDEIDNLRLISRLDIERRRNLINEQVFHPENPFKWMLKMDPRDVLIMISRTCSESRPTLLNPEE